MCRSSCLTQHLHKISRESIESSNLITSLTALSGCDIVLVVLLPSKITVSSGIVAAVVYAPRVREGEMHRSGLIHPRTSTPCSFITYIHSSHSPAITRFGWLGSRPRAASFTLFLFFSLVSRSPPLLDAPPRANVVRARGYCVALSGTRPQLRPHPSSFSTSSSISAPDSQHVPSNISQRSF
jgi:hypothetical protein